MQHLTDPVSFIFGLVFVLVFCFNVAMGELETRAGAIRFDEQPWAFTLMNSLFGTLGFLALANSLQELQWFQWFVSFKKTLIAKSDWHYLGVTYLACAVLAYTVRKYVVRANR